MSLVLIASVLISACSWFGDDEDADEFAGLSTEEQFYRRALDQLDGQNFNAAISTYQALESRFPFGRFAAQSQIEIVYAYYRNNDVEAARAAADRFIRLHPENENVDYAYYMKGLSAFSDNQGLLNRFHKTRSGTITRVFQRFFPITRALSRQPLHRRCQSKNDIPAE